MATVQDKVDEISMLYLGALRKIGLTQKNIGNHLLTGGIVYLGLDREDVDPEIDWENIIQALRDRP